MNRFYSGSGGNSFFDGTVSGGASIVFTTNSPIIWTNQTPAFQEILNTQANRRYFYNSNFNMIQWWFFDLANPAAAAIYCIQYSVDNGVTFRNTNVNTGVSVAVGGAQIVGPYGVNAWFTSGPQPLSYAAVGPLVFRVVGSGGNAIADPSFGSMQMNLWRI